MKDCSRLLFTVVALATVASACINSRTARDPFGDVRRSPAPAAAPADEGRDTRDGRPPVGADQIRVHVRNADLDRVTVNLRSHGRDERLGRVEGKDEAWFVTRWTTINDLWFEADLTSQRRCRTEIVNARPGATAYLVIDAYGRCRFEVGTVR